MRWPTFSEQLATTLVDLLSLLVSLGCPPLAVAGGDSQNALSLADEPATNTSPKTTMGVMEEKDGAEPQSPDSEKRLHL